MFARVTPVAVIQYIYLCVNLHNSQFGSAVALLLYLHFFPKKIIGNSDGNNDGSIPEL